MNTKASALQKLTDGSAALQRGQIAEAEVLLEDSLNEFSAMGDSVYVCEVCTLLAELNMMAKKPTQAFAFFERAGEQAVGVLQHSTDRLASSLHSRAILCAQTGKLVEAYLFLMHAAQVYEGTGSPKASSVQDALQQVRAHIGQAQMPAMENYWRNYQQILDQGRRGRQQSMALQLSN
jgi:hypothetical protein